MVRVKILTRRQWHDLYQYALTTRGAVELSMLVVLFVTAKDLKLKNLLGWFNEDTGRRKMYLSKHPEVADVMNEYSNSKKLFSKTHQCYLTQWRKLCASMGIVEDATFEMMRRKTFEDEENTTERCAEETL